MEAMPLRLDLSQAIWQRKLESSGHQQEISEVDESIEKMTAQHAKDSTVSTKDLYSLYVKVHSLEVNKGGASTTKQQNHVTQYRSSLDKLTQAALTNHMQTELSPVLKSTAVLANSGQQAQALPAWDIGLLRDYIKPAGSQKQGESHILFRCCCSG
jgi:hypothetical protein